MLNNKLRELTKEQLDEIIKKLKRDNQKLELGNLKKILIINELEKES